MSKRLINSTPGPWEAWRPTAERECWSVCDNEHTSCLAAVWSENANGDKLTDEANAHLIAASPGLYDALEGLVGEAVAVWGYGETYPAVAKAILALAKARNEVPEQAQGL
jgi:hypothetical protein